MNDIITTAEELDALPEMSLVIDAYGATCIRQHQTGDPLRDWVRVTPVSSSLHHPPFLPAEIERVGWGDQPTEPARCAPSREDLAAALKAHNFSRMTCLDHSHYGVSCDEVCHGVTDNQYLHHADAVLALYASQRTEAEVKAEALREHRRRVVRFMPPPGSALASRQSPTECGRCISLTSSAAVAPRIQTERPAFRAEATGRVRGSSGQIRSTLS